MEQQQQGMPFTQEAPVETLEELYNKMVFGASGNPGNDTQEVNQYASTGYCSKEEVDLMRQYARMYEMIEQELEKPFGLDLSHLKQKYVRRMNSISMTSKSLQGFSLKIMRTQHVVQDENVFQQYRDDQKKKKSILSKLTGGGGFKSMDQIAPDGIMPRDRQVWEGKQGKGTRYDGDIW